MRHLFLKIIFRYTQWISATWTILVLLDLLISKYIGTQHQFTASIFGFFISSAVSTAALNGTQWPIFLRRTSDSIKKFWIFSLAILLFNIAFNGVCYLLVCQFFKMIGIVDALMVLEPIELLWASLLIYTFGLILLWDSKAVQSSSSLRPGRHFLLIGGVYLWLLLMVPIFVFSRLIGYYFAELTLLFYFLFANQFVAGSIQVRDRWKLGIVLSAALSVLLFITFQFGIRYSNGQSTLLGLLVQDKGSQFSEIESIHKPSQWIVWMKNRKDWTPDQVNQALFKLEQLCPPIATDNPLYIDCSEKNPAEKWLSISGRSEESVVLERLASTSVYVRMLGLIGARGQEKFSPEVQEKIQAIFLAPGRLSTVAERTLNRDERDQKNAAGITVQIVNESLR